MQCLKKYNSFEDIGHIHKATAKAHMVDTDSEAFDTSDHQPNLYKLLAAYNTDRHAPREQGFFISNAAFRLLKELSPATMEQFMKVKQEKNPRHGLKE
jgi:hypothetical protein